MSAKYVKILFGFCFFTSSWQAYAHPDGENMAICIYHDTKYTCDCAYSNEPIELPIMDGNVFHVSIANCNNVVIVSNFLVNTYGLRSISFTNLRNLTLQQSALSFPQLLSSTRLIIDFNNVTIKEIQSHAFNGNIDEITFTSTQIDLIRPFAFTAFRDKAYFIKFIDTVFKLVEPQAFKKFSVTKLEITNSLFINPLPTRTFYDVEVVENLSIGNTTFNGAFSRAFSFSAVSMLAFTHNQVEKFEGECFEIKIRDSVAVRNNTFTQIHPAIFREIEVTPDSMQRSEKPEFRLIENIIHQTGDPVPIYISGNFQLVLGKLYFSTIVNCDQIRKISNLAFFKSHEDFIYLRFSENGNYLTYNQMLNIECKHSSNWLYVAIGVSCLLLLAVIVAGIVFYFVRKKQKNKLDIIMPEPKTYRETQIILQIENAGLLKTDM